MPSVVAIANQALRHIGNSIEINDLEKENTAEANACRRFYAQARDEVTRDFPWAFARRTVALALVEENPTPEWAFAYRYPNDCLMFGRILGLTRNEGTGQSVAYETASDGEGGQLIYTDYADAWGEYTSQLTDPTNWPPDFTQCVAMLIGSYIAPSVTGGDPYNLRDRTYKLYLTQVSIAQSNVLNEQQAESLPDSEFITERNA